MVRWGVTSETGFDGLFLGSSPPEDFCTTKSGIQDGKCHDTVSDIYITRIKVNGEMVRGAVTSETGFDGLFLESSPPEGFCNNKSGIKNGKCHGTVRDIYITRIKANDEMVRGAVTSETGFDGLFLGSSPPEGFYTNKSGSQDGKCHDTVSDININ